MGKDILKKFGHKIQTLRKAEGWSQEQLADKSGFHRTYIGMVERGERNPSLINIEKFAAVFKLEIKDLFTS